MITDGHLICFSLYHYKNNSYYFHNVMLHSKWTLKSVVYHLLCIYFYAYDNFTNCSAMLNLQKPTIDLFRPIYYNISASKLVNYETSKLKIIVLNSLDFQKWCYTSSFCNLYLFIIYTLKEEHSDENHFLHAKVVL